MATLYTIKESLVMRLSMSAIMKNTHRPDFGIILSQFFKEEYTSKLLDLIPKNVNLRKKFERDRILQYLNQNIYMLISPFLVIPEPKLLSIEQIYSPEDLYEKYL